MGICADLESANCAIDHISRVANLYPGRYEPNFHAYVFEDIKELFFITLTTNRKDVASIDSRAIGMPNFATPFTSAEARKIVSQTTFVSSLNGDWSIEVQHSRHKGKLVEATTVSEDKNMDDGDSLSSTDSIAETEEEEEEEEEEGGGHCTSLVDTQQERELKSMEDELEREYKVIESVKEDLAKSERILLHRTGQMMELKNTFQAKWPNFVKYGMSHYHTGAMLPRTWTRNIIRSSKNSRIQS